MILLLDLGNTRLKWAWLAGDRLRDSGALVHDGQDLAAVLAEPWRTMPAPAAIHVASVAPAPLRERLAALLASRWNCPVHWAATRTEQAGVRNGYAEPSQLGVDRWLALLGAWRRVQGAACVVDCGSAITVDILDSQGRHLGGVIAPGLRLMREALHQGTALPVIRGTGAESLGRDTQAAIRAGTEQALRGLIERCRVQAPPDAPLLLTGGDAPAVAAGLEGPCQLVPDLVLEGLACTLEGV